MGLISSSSSTQLLELGLNPGLCNIMTTDIAMAVISLFDGLKLDTDQQ